MGTLSDLLQDEVFELRERIAELEVMCRDLAYAEQETQKQLDAVLNATIGGDRIATFAAVKDAVHYSGDRANDL